MRGELFNMETGKAPRARLYVDVPLAADVDVTLDGAPVTYLRSVLRARTGETILLFNGRDGEWRGSITDIGKKSVTLTLEAQTRPQTPPGDLWYLFAPLKHARLDYMAQKAVEMGASRLQPVMTARTQAGRVNTERLAANAIEAAEQCGILTLPEIGAPMSLTQMLADWPKDRQLIFCDEALAGESTQTALARIRPGPLGVLIGPEGGFDASERAALVTVPDVVCLPLGPRILRADTAGVAALALVNFIAEKNNI